jgi:agmatinase
MGGGGGSGGGGGGGGGGEVENLLFLAARPGTLGSRADARRGASPRPAAILGVPLDRTTSYRGGTATGPREIRAASWSLESYSPALGADLEDVSLYDFGDVALGGDGSDGGGSLTADLEVIESAVADLAARGFLPVAIGGEHLLTLGAYRGVLRARGLSEPPVLLHFDAHADLREAYEGETLSHATVVRRIAALTGGRNIYQFGVRSGEREEMRWGQANVNRIPGTLAGATREALRAVAGRPVYCSVDIDIVDPSHAPGTGNPEPAGPSASDVLEAVTAVATAAAVGPQGGGIDLAGFDLVETSPPLDPTGRTSVLAAKILREFLIARG